MLAPRQTLWASPQPVVDAALELLELTPGDTLCDYGCGDGIALATASTRYRCRAIGYEIHEARAHAVQARMHELGLQDLVTVRCMNALEADPTEPSAVFLYLIERGLKLLLPFLQRAASLQPSGVLRVVTVLYRIPGLRPVTTQKLHTSDTIMFPLHLYHIRASDATAEAAADVATESTTGDA